MMFQLSTGEYPYYCPMTRTVYFEPGIYYSLYQLEFIRYLSLGHTVRAYTCATERSLENRKILEPKSYIKLQLTELGFWRAAEYIEIRDKLMVCDCVRSYISEIIIPGKPETN